MANTYSQCNLDGGELRGQFSYLYGESNGTPLQYSCLANPMGGGALVGCSPWGHYELDTTE